MPHDQELSRYFLAYRAASLNESYAEASEALQSELGIRPHSRNAYPHVTIKSSFSLSRTENSGLVRNLTEMARTRVIEAVQACTGEGFGCFEESGTIYLPVGGPRHSIRRILAQFAQWGYPPVSHEGETPHVTYANRVDPALIPKALQVLRGLKIPYKTVFPLDRLLLFVQEPCGGESFWRVSKEIYLKLP